MAQTKLKTEQIENLLLADITDVTASVTELNYVDGVTSAIQTQLDAKQGTDTQLTSLAALSYTGNASKYIRVNAGETDFELATVSGAGDVSKVGTPVANRMAYWTGDGTLGHEAGFTYDPTTDTLTTVNVVGTTLKAGNGTSVAPGFAFSSDASTGMYLGSGNVEITVGGTPTFRFLSNGTNASLSTLAMGANSITMTGSLAATGSRVTKGWFTDVESTNMYTVGGTSLSSTFQGLDATLTALAAYNTNGILTQTAADTFTGRTITGTANQVTLTNGSGVSGNPTVSLPNEIILSGSLATGNTVASDSTSAYRVLGATTTTRGLATGVLGGGTRTANENFFTQVIGQATLTEASSGTHAGIGSLAVRAPVITDGAGATTNAVTVYIEAAPTGTATPTNVYALWVDAGEVRIDGDIGDTTNRVAKGWFTGLESTTIELGAASDTTLSRVSAGVVAIEGVNIDTVSSTATLTNKTIIATTNVVEEITTTASSGTPTPTGGSLRNFFTITALATAPTFAAPSGTPADGNYLTIRIKDNGTARALTWNAIYRASTDQALPTTTVLSKTMYVGFRYNSADSKWDCMAVNNGF
jgi:hypothetical protein